MKPDASYEPLPTEALISFLLELLAEGKTVRLTVTGYSMMPLLFNERDSVLLAKPKKLRNLDVVLYLQPDGKPILHRIIKCRKDGYMIVGDNQNEPDGPIGREQIKAVVTGFCRNGREVSVDAWWYRLYSFFWGHCRPLRRYLFPLVEIGSRFVKRMERLK